MNNPYITHAFYLFTPLDDPHLLVQKHKDFFRERDCRGRIYISEEGINCQMSGKALEADAYISWLKEDPRFSGVWCKTQEIPENIFPRMTVKYRKQLVALDETVDPAEGGTYVSPSQWKEMVATGEYLLLDVRNRYEWKIGHFTGATLPPLESFRDFRQYATELSSTHAPDTKIMMYCTTGIRCELFSALLKKNGFSEIYQLEGGVVQYGAQEGNTHWEGLLFVFDDRLAIPLDKEKNTSPISRCHHCHEISGTYYNCANMDCNELFICCPSCREAYIGCCSFACKTSPRVRPFDPSASNKPFRRKHEISCALSTAGSAVVSPEAPESNQV